jgi:ribosomal protein L29
MATTYHTIKELRQKGEAELQKMLTEARTSLQELSFQASSKQLKDVSAVRKAKRQVALILATLGELNKK